MLYVLYTSDYDGEEVHGVWEGPHGLDIPKLLDAFEAEFDHRKLGKPKSPKYTGPTVLYNPGPFCSGSIAPGTLIWDQNSEEYRQWDKEDKKVSKEWQARRDEKIKEWKNKYPGKDVFEMGLSYLEAELGLKKVEAKLMQI